MKAFKKVAFFSFLIFSLFACKMDLAFDSNENFEDEISTSITFYSCEDGGSSSPVTLSKRLYQGERYTSGQLLTSAELSSLGNTGDFLGYKFYRKTGTAETAIPNYVFPDSQGFISSIVITTDSIDIIAYFGNSYRVNHFLQNIDGSTYPSTPYLTQTFSAEAGENSNATVLFGSDIAGFTFDSSRSDTLVQPVAEDGSTVINLYYTRNLIYLTINLNGGNIGGNYANATLSGRYGASTASEIEANIPTDPELTGKYFAGWEPPLPATFPASNASYSAVWSSSLYNIAFNSNGGSGTMATLTNRVYETEYTLPANTFTKATSDGTAYQFNGWNTQADGNGTDYADEQSVNALTSVHNSTVTLYAQWKAPYKVNHKFEEKHSGGGSPRYYTRRTEIKYAVPGENTAAEALSADDELMPGYELSGTISQQPVSADGTTAIDINYRLKQITLTFNLNGGNIGGDTSKTANVTETGYYNFTNIIKAGSQGGETLASGWQDDVEWEGRIFSGWLDSETGGVITTLPEKFPPADKTYTAQWDIQSYTLTYNGNGSTGGTVPVVSAPIEYTATVNVNFPAGLTRTGYDFAGWNTSADGSGTAYTSGGTTSFTMPASNVTLYAQWTPVDYTITYELDGGTNNASNPATYTIETPVTLEAATKTDYAFCGWYEESDLSGTAVTAIAAGSTGNKTLYAKWLPVYASVKGVNYGTKDDAIAAITEATGDISIVLYSPVTTDDLGKSGTSGTILNAIRQKTEATDSVSLSIADGVTITAPANCYTMFGVITRLVSADLRGLDTSSVQNMEYMFNGCSALTSLNVSTFDTSNVTNMYSMFYSSPALTELNLSSFDTSNVTKISNLFYGCTALETITFGDNFTTSNITDFSSMFNGCNSLISLDLTKFDTSRATKMDNMFFNCLALTSLNLSSFDTSSVTSMTKMFNTCSTLTTITVSDSFVTNAVTSSNNMFYGCSNLVGGAGTPYYSSKIDATYARIDGGTSNPGYFTAAP